MSDDVRPDVPRMPLEPLLPTGGEADAKYSERRMTYEALLSEADRLWNLHSHIEEMVSVEDREDGAEYVNLSEYNTQLESYMLRREAYIKANDGYLETYEMVCEKLRAEVIEGKEDAPLMDEDPPEPPDFTLMLDNHAEFERQYAEYAKRLADWEMALRKFTEGLARQGESMIRLLKERSKFKRFDDQFEEMAKHTYILPDGTIEYRPERP